MNFITEVVLSDLLLWVLQAFEYYLRRTLKELEQKNPCCVTDVKSSDSVGYISQMLTFGQ